MKSCDATLWRSERRFNEIVIEILEKFSMKIARKDSRRTRRLLLPMTIFLSNKNSPSNFDST
jgi:hypothetical protein